MLICMCFCMTKSALVHAGMHNTYLPAFACTSAGIRGIKGLVGIAQSYTTLQ